MSDLATLRQQIEWAERRIALADGIDSTRRRDAEISEAQALIARCEAAITALGEQTDNNDGLDDVSKEQDTPDEFADILG